MKSECIKITNTGYLKPIRPQACNYSLEAFTSQEGDNFHSSIETIYSASIKVFASMSVPSRLEKQEVDSFIVPQLESQLRRELYKDIYNWVHSMYQTLYDPDSALSYEERNNLLSKIDELQDIMGGK